MPTWARPLEIDRFAAFWSGYTESLTGDFPADLHFPFWEVASVATVSVFDLNFAGTSAAILLSVAGVEIVVEVVVVVALVVVVAAFLLLPPQPAARTTTRARTASPAADGVFIRFMLGPFLCGSWAPALDE